MIVCPTSTTPVTLCSVLVSRGGGTGIARYREGVGTGISGVFEGTGFFLGQIVDIIFVIFDNLFISNLLYIAPRSGKFLEICRNF